MVDRISAYEQLSEPGIILQYKIIQMKYNSLWFTVLNEIEEFQWSPGKTLSTYKWRVKCIFNFENNTTAHELSLLCGSVGNELKIP